MQRNEAGVNVRQVPDGLAWPTRNGLEREKGRMRRCFTTTMPKRLLSKRIEACTAAACTH